jgi:hypothetical protein
MDAFQAYSLYLALKQHFTPGRGYDFFKYNGKANASKNAFETRKDKYFFHKLSKKDDPKAFLVANFVKFGPKTWIGDIVNEPKHEDAYIAWMKRKESMAYMLKTDLECIESIETDLKVTDGQYPKLLALYMRNKIGLETIIILDYYLKFLKRWDSEIQDRAFWPDIYSLCVAYRPFVEFDKEKALKTALQVINDK